MLRISIITTLLALVVVSCEFGGQAVRHQLLPIPLIIQVCLIAAFIETMLYNLYYFYEYTCFIFYCFQVFQIFNFIVNLCLF